MAEEKKKGFFSGKGLFPKILILIALAVLIASVLFGLPVDIPSAFWFMIRVLLAVGIFVVAIMLMEKVVSSGKTFSPSTSWKNKIISVAEMSKPPRTRKLWLRGEDGHMFYYFGKITGLLKIPYWSGKPVMDKFGNYLYTHKRDKNGELMYTTDNKPIYINDRENITNRDADWVFVITKGLIPAVAKKYLVRAHMDLCSEIGEEVWIKSVNLVPIGDWLYPEQMFQSNILRINQQSMHEVMEETMHHLLDMTATQVESTLRADPIFMKMMTLNTENISSKENAPVASLGAGNR